MYYHVELLTKALIHFAFLDDLYQHLSDTVNFSNVQENGGSLCQSIYDNKNIGETSCSRMLAWTIVKGMECVLCAGIRKGQPRVNFRHCGDMSHFIQIGWVDNAPLQSAVEAQDMPAQDIKAVDKANHMKELEKAACLQVLPAALSCGGVRPGGLWCIQMGRRGEGKK